MEALAMYVAEQIPLLSQLYKYVFRILEVLFVCPIFNF